MTDTLNSIHNEEEQQGGGGLNTQLVIIEMQTFSGGVDGFRHPVQLLEGRGGALPNNELTFSLQIDPWPDVINR